MNIPGRFRTGSRPSSTDMSLAVYVPSKAPNCSSSTFVITQPSLLVFVAPEALFCARGTRWVYGFRSGCKRSLPTQRPGTFYQLSPPLLGSWGWSEADLDGYGLDRWAGHLQPAEDVRREQPELDGPRMVVNGYRKHTLAECRRPGVRCH